MTHPPVFGDQRRKGSDLRRSWDDTTARDAACIRRPHAVWTTCGCPPCVKDRRRMAKLARNGKVSRVPVEVAWSAFRTMADRGWSGRAIASATGISENAAESALGRLRNGQVQRFGPRAAAALVAAGQPTDGMIGACGSRRRLQALARLGWTLDHAAQGTGIGYSTLAAIRVGGTRTVHAAMHNVIAEYTTRVGMSVGPSTPARISAERKGWLPLLAWDDDTIDDPDAEPYIATEPVRVGAPGLDIEDVEFMLLCGENRYGIAARLGVKPDTVYQALHRAGRTDLVERLEAA